MLTTNHRQTERSYQKAQHELKCELPRNTCLIANDGDPWSLSKIITSLATTIATSIHFKERLHYCELKLQILFILEICPFFRFVIRRTSSGT